MTKQRPTHGNRGGAALALSMLCLSVLGCQANNAEFVMRNRPQATVMRGEEAIPYYSVHVGDTVSLAFRSKLYFCDYAIMRDSQKDAFEDCGPDLGGAFEWPYRFTTITPPGELATLHVTAYSSLGKRDKMPYKGKIMELEVGTDSPDKVAAEADMFVRVYQSRLVIPVDLGGATPMWHAARLEMSGQGVRKRRITHSSADREGHFSVEGPDGMGRYQVIYEPTIKDIDPTGVTTAVLKVPDEDANIHEFTAELRPPQIDAPANDGAGGPEGMAPMSCGDEAPREVRDGGTPRSLDTALGGARRLLRIALPEISGTGRLTFALPESSRTCRVGVA
ncbi:MAG TPA: hypothetical protein PK093_16665 [Phycisphaerae bacterium]|nr:hypothetical protein [Phycisphaerae bacterium]